MIRFMTDTINAQSVKTTCATSHSVSVCVDPDHFEIFLTMIYGEPPCDGLLPPRILQNQDVGFLLMSMNAMHNRGRDLACELYFANPPI